jgi:glutathione synthase/RimK-type ligase-like ATP-grasp enzyme
MLQDKCNIPEWTTHKGKVTKEGLWVARTKLTGFGGEGIILFDPKEELPPDAPLYVQYKKKKKEFRVHVFKGEVIDITQKKKRKDFDGEINTKIRNYANGWVYCREDIEEPDDLRLQATLAVGALGLDFGAVDCIWNEKENKTYILEANTAPGMEGQTIEAYKNAILKSLTL